MLKDKKNIKVLIIIILLFSLSGCNKVDEKKIEIDKDTLIIGQGADARSLDPHETNDQPSSRVMKQIYDTLFIRTEDMQLVSGLAESWQRVDELTIKIKLRKGVKFHNGEELTSKDVKFTLERMLKSDKVSHIIKIIDTIDIIDNYNLVIKTKEPFGPLLTHLSHTASSILNEKAIKELGESYGQHPIGTGPYKFKNWDKGDKIELESFDNYYRGKSDVKNIIFRNIPNGLDRAEALQNGEAQIAYSIDQADKNRIEKDQNLKILEGPSLEMIYLGFNMEKRPFYNKSIRQAINYAINVDEIIDGVLRGVAQKANSPIGPRVFGYNYNIKPYEYNPELARKMLKEAGYEAGFDTKLVISDNPERKKVAEMIRDQLRQVGITVNIEVADWSTYLDKTAKGEHEMFISGWLSVTGDADYGLYGMYHSTDKGGETGNRFFYKNKLVDQLLKEGRKYMDPEKREATYKRLQKIIVEDAVGVLLYYPTQNVALYEYIEGFELHPTGDHSLYNVKIK